MPVKIPFLNTKLIGLTRYCFTHYLSGLIPYYIVNEYPKSGGTWLGQMLSDLLDVPFPRNSYPTLKPSIMHCHYLHKKNMKNVVVIWRDGRDLMVSWYYHCLFKNELGNHRLVDIVTNDLNFSDPEDIYENLPGFIEYAFTQQKHPPFSWSDYVMQWYGQDGVVFIKYESLRINPVDELARIVEQLTGDNIDRDRITDVVDKYSFEKLSGRKPGTENKTSFLRKGVVGDWVNIFSYEAKQQFMRHAQSELELLEYENTTDWAEQ
jgi:hypothetical protein